MKISSYLYLILIVALYVANYFFLKINWFPFTGIVLAGLIVLIILINIYVKLRNKNKLHSDDFIFSPDVAKSMKKVDLGIQYEASIISLFFLMVGMLLMIIYTVFFTPYSIILKVFIAFNSFFALILMSSMLITNYQQFIAYRESTQMFAQFTNNVGTEVVSQDKLTNSAPLPSLESLNTPTEKQKTLDLTDEDVLKEIFDNKNERRLNN